MAKRKVYVIEYKYPNNSWAEYARTSVERILSTYVENCQREYMGADVRYRLL